MPDPRHQILVRSFCDEYKRRTGHDYLFTGKDAKMVQTLLKALPDDTVDGLMEVVRWAWCSRDQFHRKAAASLPMLVSQWNQIRAAMPAKVEHQEF